MNWKLPFFRQKLELTNKVDTFTEPNKYPMKTNSWFSSAYKFPSEYIHALPGMYKFTSEGMRISTQQVAVQPTAIVSSMGDDCTLSFDGKVRDVTIEKYGDWHVNLNVKTDNHENQVQIVQGSPFVYASLQGESATFICPDSEISMFDQYSLIKHHGKLYLLQVKSGSLANQANGSILINSNEVRVGILPDETLLALFYYNSWNILEDTRVSISTTATDWETSYQFLYGQKNKFLTTIWPHQLGYLSSMPKIVGEHVTTRGKLHLALIDGSFTTKTPKNQLMLDYVSVEEESMKQEMTTLLADDARDYLKQTPPTGVYFRGTWLGALTSLVQLNDTYAVDEYQSQLTDLLYQTLQASLKQMRYAKDLQMVVADNPEFGNEQGNDHHFHYGYYIRAAAVLMAKGKLSDDEISQVNQLVMDIASPQTTSEFPKMRNYSVYEGHSWASGLAPFADGNNQESTSEALNAWYGVYLWGKATNQELFEKTGGWLFDQELIGTKTYWFGEANPFPNDYPHQMASIVWGSKRDFATWFSADPMHIYGIQWLPLTPASRYLGSFVNAENHLNEINNLVADPIGHEWGDLFLAYASFYDPEFAVSNYGRLHSHAGSKLRSLPYHLVMSNMVTAKK